MKRYLYVFAVLTLVSCGEKSKEAKQGLEIFKNAAKAVASADDVAERQAELSEMEAMSPEAFEQWAPESFLGLSLARKESLAKDKYGYTGINLYYKAEEGSDKARITVMDGAGSNIYSSYSSMFAMTGMQQETDTYYEKIVEKKGYQAVETYDSGRNDGTLNFIENERFVIKMNFQGMHPDKIWDNLNQLQLDNLAN